MLLRRTVLPLRTLAAHRVRREPTARPPACLSCSFLPASCRLPFQYVEGMEGSGERRLLVAATRVIKMRANAADAPYVVERAGPGEAHPAALHWEFELSYTRLEGVVPLAQRMMVASRLPAAEQEEFLQVCVPVGGCACGCGCCV